MPRHESITNDFITELNAGFARESVRVKTAPNWPETQKRIVTGTNPYQVALGRVEEGWSGDEINPIRVIGDRQVDEKESGSN